MLPVYLNNHEVIRFLAPQITDSRAIIPPIGLPVREPGDKPVAIFVDRENTWIIDEAKLYYPNAEFHVDNTPNGNPALYRCSFRLKIFSDCKVYLSAIGWATARKANRCSFMMKNQSELIGRVSRRSPLLS